MAPDLPVSFADVIDAASRMGGQLHRTPVITSAALDAELGASIFFKCENLQKTGAFKARGATNAVALLGDADAAAGVVTHSSGNHGAALAWAAAQRDITCTVVAPESANPSKLAAMRGYGAELVLCPEGRRQEYADRVLAERGGRFVHPFDDPHVIAGQGTAALELVEDVPELDLVMAPIGGGGLLSGTAIVAATHGIEVIGAEPAAVDDAARSLDSGVRQPAVVDPHTVADGLLTGIGELPFVILASLGVPVRTVTEDAITAAARFHLERMKLVVEPSGAVPLAALRSLGPAGRRVGVIISGGNTDFAWMSPT